jgi:hypothetical protein
LRGVQVFESAFRLRAVSGAVLFGDSERTGFVLFGMWVFLCEKVTLHFLLAGLTIVTNHLLFEAFFQTNGLSP